MRAPIFLTQQNWSMIPKKPAPDIAVRRTASLRSPMIRGGNRFSEMIMLKQKARVLLRFNQKQ